MPLDIFMFLVSLQLLGAIENLGQHMGYGHWLIRQIFGQKFCLSLLEGILDLNGNLGQLEADAGFVALVKVNAVLRKILLQQRDA